MRRRILAVGECMVELAPVGGGLYRRGFAGDSFNTAWYLRRELGRDWAVDYVSGAGTDPVSDEMLRFMEGAGIGTATVRRVPDRTVGLYMIEVRAGERSFTYWRSQSAARLLAEDGPGLARLFREAGMVFLSGITVAVVLPDHRPALTAALAEARAAEVTVVFDPNLRPRLWPDAATMCRAVTETAAVADVLLPSHEDERSFFGDADPAATIERYRALGARTVVAKDGAAEVTAWDAEEGRAAAMPHRVEAVDTTAAGDSFNAAFLAARLAGRPLGEALAAGAALAAEVVRHPGALVEAARG